MSLSSTLFWWIFSKKTLAPETVCIIPSSSKDCGAMYWSFGSYCVSKLHTATWPWPLTFRCQNCIYSQLDITWIMPTSNILRHCSRVTADIRPTDNQNAIHNCKHVAQTRRMDNNWNIITHRRTWLWHSNSTVVFCTKNNFKECTIHKDRTTLSTIQRQAMKVYKVLQCIKHLMAAAAERCFAIVSNLSSSSCDFTWNQPSATQLNFCHLVLITITICKFIECHTRQQRVAGEVSVRRSDLVSQCSCTAVTSAHERNMSSLFILPLKPCMSDFPISN